MGSTLPSIPHWTDLVFYAIMYALMIGVSWVTISPFLQTLAKFHGVKTTPWLSRFVGATEEMLYVTVLLIGQPTFVAAWLVVKAVGQRAGSDEVEAKGYSIYLIGTALSVMLAFLAAVIMQALLPGYHRLTAQWGL